MKKTYLIMCFFFAVSCLQKKTNTEAQKFIDEYNTKIKALSAASAEAHWAANTKIVEGDTTNATLVQKADEAYTEYSGSKQVIEKTREFLKDRKLLTIVQQRQLDAILYNAAGSPQTAEKLVKELIRLGNSLNETLYGHTFTINGKEVTTGEIAEILKKQESEKTSLRAWNSSKEVGKKLKNGLDKIRNLRNGTVQALGYQDYFHYQVSDYGMNTEEMIQLNNTFLDEIWPLYREIHTWARYTLAKKFGADVPEFLPAHWLPNRWGQDWSALVTVKGLDFDKVIKTKSAEWVVKEGEKFYESLGFKKLPKSFYEKSSLYPLPKDAGYKKNNHASAWHMDLENDVRCLMSVEPTAEYYETVHHEFGHIYYYLEYSNKEVPYTLRGGANRAFHEAIGSMLGLAATQKSFLVGRGLVDKNAETDKMQTLFKEALNYIVFMPWSSGVMTNFEKELYANTLSNDDFNKKWWKMKKEYQGIIPPNERGDEFCDATTKTHIINDAAQYYDYALSFVILFQVHKHIAENILHQDPHDTNYYGNKKVGKFLHKILSPGANCDWRELMKTHIGEEISANAMLEYFAPLMDYLKEQNKDRKHTLPERKQS